MFSMVLDAKPRLWPHCPASQKLLLPPEKRWFRSHVDGTRHRDGERLERLFGGIQRGVPHPVFFFFFLVFFLAYYFWPFEEY